MAATNCPSFPKPEAAVCRLVPGGWSLCSFCDNLEFCASKSETAFFDTSGPSMPVVRWSGLSAHAYPAAAGYAWAESPLHRTTGMLGPDVSKNAVSDLLAQNSKLSQKLQRLQPPGTNLQTA